MTKERDIHEMITNLIDGKIPETLEEKEAYLKEMEEIRKAAQELGLEAPKKCGCCGRVSHNTFWCNGCGKDVCFETCATSVFGPKGEAGKMLGTFCLDCMMKIFNQGLDFSIGQSLKLDKSPEEIAKIRQQINRMRI